MSDDRFTVYHSPFFLTGVLLKGDYMSNKDIIPIMYILCGLPGSGKSTLAERLHNETGAVIISSDSLREKLYGDENDQTGGYKIFQLMKSNAEMILEDGRSVIIDATNIRPKYRKTFLDISIPSKEKIRVVAYAFKNDPETAKLRDGERMASGGRFVPFSVIDSMSKNYTYPTKEEGFDEVYDADQYLEASNTMNVLFSAMGIGGGIQTKSAVFIDNEIDDREND